MTGDPLAFKRHVLASGTRLFYQHRSLPFTGARVLVHAGCRQDPEGKTELMHLLEHLVGADMRGIPSASVTELQNWLVGQRFNAMLGMTSLDFCAYAVQAENARFGPALRFLAQLVREPTLKSQLDKERDIIRRERDEMEPPKERKRNAARNSAVFGTHWRRSCPSWAEDADLDKLTIEDARAAHARWYHPANLSLLIAGGIDEDRALRLAERLFTASDEPFVAPKPLPPRTFAPPKRRSYRQKADGKPELVEVAACWHLPLVSAPAMLLASNCLEDRLTERIRETMRASYGAERSVSTNREYRTLEIAVRVVPGQVSAIRRIMLEEADRLTNFGQADLERFGGALRMNYLFSEPDIDQTFDAATTPLILTGKPQTMAETIRRLQATTSEQVRALAGEHLSSEKAFVELVEE